MIHICFQKLTWSAPFKFSRSLAWAGVAISMP
ncbi:MAG: hypothetical protein ACI9I4_002210, partial [Neolewinella sp.]